MEIARPTLPPSSTPQVSSPVESSNTAVTETSGFTNVLDNLSATGSSSNLDTVFSPTYLVGDANADSDEEED